MVSIACPALHARSCRRLVPRHGRGRSSTGQSRPGSAAILRETEQVFSMLNMSSGDADADLTSRASIRNAALRLFGERGHDAVTIRDIAAAAGVSPALVLHHFGSKDGLRTQVDQYAAEAFDSLFAELDDDAMEAMVADGGASASLAEAFGRSFPPGSPLPSYLRRLLLTNDPAGAALFGRWYTATH